MNLKRVCTPLTLVLTALVFFQSVSLFFFHEGYAHDTMPGAQTTAPDTYERVEQMYSLPDVTLMNQDGVKVRFKNLVDSGKPVILNFIFTSCTTICPLLATAFSRLQIIMGEEADHVTLISISSDPDHDSPPIMKEYLHRLGAKPGWEFLTGTPEDIAQVMKAFDAQVGNKMDHFPLKFLHAPGAADQWVRLNGLIGGSRLIEEYRKLLNSPQDTVPSGDSDHV